MTGYRYPVSRVVVAFDGSAPSRAALRTGVDEALLRHVPLHLVTAVDTVGGLPLAVAVFSDTAQQVSDEARDWAEGILGEGRATAAVEFGRPAAVTLRIARQGDLLVVGSHGHRPVARMLLGSTSTALATHASCPVLVVKGSRPRADAPVVVGVDGSKTSMSAVQLAADAADRHGAELHAVIAVPPVVDALGFVSGPDEPVLQEGEAVLSESLAGIREHYPDLKMTSVVAQTHPVEALMRHSRGAGLVVVGSRGRGGVKSMLLGSVSREMLQRSPCSVAVVHPVADEDETTDRASAGRGKSSHGEHARA